jgi:beta-xylosidase/endo-1,4-beta-D-glucanase Y
MKQLKYLVPAILLLALCSCVKTEKTDHKAALFNYFAYQGADETCTDNIDSLNQYQNPVVGGFYPDPSVCRKDSDYYLVMSSFSYYPGIPVFHSRDLVNWVQIGNVLNRRSQLELKEGVRLSGGVYAPTIRYNRHNDTFYLINTCVDGIGNFIVKTKNPLENNWSEPVPLHFGGIDPDIFFDDDGKAYIAHNDEPPGAPEWNGHRAIWLREFDAAGDSIFGEKICIVDGGVDKSKHPVWIEAPHLYKIDGYYYLMCAEGGTAEDHSEVIFRANQVKGPYIPWKNNPILTQRDLPADRPYPVTCAGHADLVETPEGDWHAVFLACRPYAGDHYNTGRETFMLPVSWQDGYPVILPQGEAIPYTVRKAHLQPNPASLKGNFNRRDDFDGDSLGACWLMLRTPPANPWWQIAKGQLALHSTGQTILEDKQPAFIALRQQHLHFEAQAEMIYQPVREGDIAGIVCYQKETHNLVFGKTMDGNGNIRLVLNRAKGTVEQLAAATLSGSEARKSITLKVVGKGDKYAFLYSFEGGNRWETLADNVDASALSTRTAGGFSGVVIGMYHYQNPFPVKPALKPETTGAFETGNYRNLFAKAGYPENEIREKLNRIFQELFEGENKVYFEVGDSMAYISDLKNHDVRTEGMSYGMMIAVQFDRKDIFDRLWRWSVKYMQHADGALKGYFAWSLKTDGTRNAQGPASDGELYYITSLLFAANRWGNDTGIDYLKEAQYIVDCAFAKDGTDRIVNFIDTTHRLITFVPGGDGSQWTDPSYHVPAFYEVWARWLNDGRSGFWNECAAKAREYLHQSIHPETALNPDQNHYDGSILERETRFGPYRNDAFRFDSWRVPMNIALDYAWSCADREWQQEYGHKFQDFLYLQGVNTFVDQYTIDGSPVTWILPAGGYTRLRHSIGLAATAAAVSLTCSHPKSHEFIDAFWRAENRPYADGYFDAYYDGLLQLFSFMHLSGNYRIIFPNDSFGKIVN